MIPHFALYRDRKEFLIIRMGDEFHIIDCDDALTAETRAAVLESGCTPAEMLEMGLSGMTIPKGDIRGLSVAGCDFMDEVILRLKGKKLAYRFFDRYDMDAVDEFFRGVPRREYRPGGWLWEGRRGWRRAEQDSGLFWRLRPVGWVWNLLCVGIAAWPLIWNPPMAVWGWVVTALCLAAVVLESFFPDYFSLLFRYKKKQFGGSGRAIHLSFGLMLALYVFAIGCRARYHVIGRLTVLPAALGLTLAVGAVLYLFCREFTEEPGAGLVTMALVLLLSYYAFIPHFNHMLKPELQSQTGTIVEKRESLRRYGHKYFCTVLLPDGREVVVAVSWDALERYEIGDPMELEVGTGFFGIDYAWTDERKTR